MNRNSFLVGLGTISRLQISFVCEEVRYGVNPSSVRLGNTRIQSIGRYMQVALILVLPILCLC